MQAGRKSTGGPLPAPIRLMAVPSAGQSARALEVLEQHQEQLIAVSMLLKNSLSTLCNEGDSPPDGAPLTEWRVSQVLHDLCSHDIIASLRRCFGLPADLQEAHHV